VDQARLPFSMVRNGDPVRRDTSPLPCSERTGEWFVTGSEIFDMSHRERRDWRDKFLSLLRSSNNHATSNYLLVVDFADNNFLFPALTII
jgi:hypothetical protein